jgi:hypothetical protein
MFRIKSAKEIPIKPVEQGNPWENQGEVRTAAGYPARWQVIDFENDWR